MALGLHNFLLVLVILQLLAICRTSRPDGACHIQHQALICQYLNSTHVDLVREKLTEISHVWPNFGLAFDKCEISDFPDDIFQEFNITTFGHIPDRRDLERFPLTPHLMNLKSNLSHLYLVATSVHNSDLEDFKNFPFKNSLRFLDLRFNMLDHIDSDSFLEFPNLEVLHLLGNKLTRVPTHSFEGLQHLRTLNLSQNALTELEDEAFKGLPSLTHLDLSYAKFTAVPKNVFVTLDSLQSLSLKFNKIEALEKDVFNDEDLPKLSDIKLEGNPLNCDCSLQWLKLWLTSKDLLTSSNAKCFNSGFSYKRFEVIDFCPEVDDDEIVEIEEIPEVEDVEVEDEEEEVEEFEEGSEEVQEKVEPVLETEQENKDEL